MDSHNVIKKKKRLVAPGDRRMELTQHDRVPPCYISFIRHVHFTLDMKIKRLEKINSELWKEKNPTHRESML